MINYYGDYPEDHTHVQIPFNTFTSDDPSASVTITNLADADIKVHKDGHVDQIVTDGASVVINFDSITGNHLITIDTSVDAAYATGHEYQVRIEGTTVDGAIINAWVGSFSIERAGGVLALIKAGTIDVNTKTITNGIVVAATLGADCITAAKVADDVHNQIADAVWDEVLTGATHNDATSAGRRLRQAADTMIIRDETCQAGGGNDEVILDVDASGVDDFYINSALGNSL